MSEVTHEDKKKKVVKMDAGTMETAKQMACIFLFICGGIGWAGHVFFAWRNDIRRHREVTSFIELFQNHNGKLIAAYANILTEMQNNRYLLVERHIDGSLTVRALGRSEPEKIAEELESQRNGKQQ
jgi:hypothetical protein